MKALLHLRCELVTELLLQNHARFLWALYEVPFIGGIVFYSQKLRMSSYDLPF